MSRADVLACTRDDDRLRKWVSDATCAGVSDTKHPLLDYCAGICQADVLASTGDDTITLLLCQTQNILKYCSGMYKLLLEMTLLLNAKWTQNKSLT